MLPVLLVATLWVNNDALGVYREAARWLSPLFLLYQTVLVISFANDWNEGWVNRPRHQAALDSLSLSHTHTHTQHSHALSLTHSLCR